MKLLVDECLSEELAKVARQRGWVESSHVVWLGKRSWKDWSLMPLIVDGDWTFVTRNSADFRGSHGAVGSKGHHSKVALHAGLICLNGPVRMDLEMQIELFGLALDEIAGGELVNQCLEVTADDADKVTIRRYALPGDDPQESDARPFASPPPPLG
jgi:predicted nuclease of predicted toxin-antitoxin system